MSSETNDPPPPPRRSPKLFPDAPPPLEAAEAPRQVFRLRTEAPKPSEGPSNDKARELFFINWQAQNPGGKVDSEDFERAYGDFQIRQTEAKGYYRERERTAPVWPIVRRALIIGFLIVAAFAAFNWIRTQFEPRLTAPRSSSSIGGAPNTIGISRHEVPEKQPGGKRRPSSHRFSNSESPRRLEVRQAAG